MNRSKVAKEAEAFGKPGRCFIHVEKYAGKDSEMVIAGDFQEMIQCASHIVSKIAEIGAKAEGLPVDASKHAVVSIIYDMVTRQETFKTEDLS